VWPAKRWYRDERERETSDRFRKLWKSLVARVDRVPEGFSDLTDPEQLYVAVCLLVGEVENGGFEQYFFNSSSDWCAYAERGLSILGASVPLALLRDAKRVAFGEREIPTDTERRRAVLRQLDEAEYVAQLDAIDQAFCENRDAVVQRLKEFARERNLIGSGA
jgi:hypothetical protein